MVAPVRPSAAELLAEVDPVLRALVRGWAAAYRLDFDDTLQDARLIVFEHAAEFDPAVSSPETWARSLARGALRDGVESRAREARLREKHAEQSYRAADDELAEVFSRESGEMIVAAIAELPPRQAEVVRLRFGIGCKAIVSYRSLATELKCDAGALARQMALAAEALRARLQSLAR